ncbi:MAG: YfhO family protein [Acidobacteriota bacterium]
MRGESLRHAATVAAAFALFHVLFFARVPLAGRILAPGDGIVQNVPAYESPWGPWSEDLFTGYPIGADPQNQQLYPPKILLRLLHAPYDAFVVLAYVLASVFAYALAYELTGSRASSAAAGLVYGMSGFFVAHLGHVNMIHAAAWIPALLAAIERLRSAPTARRTAIAAIAAAHLGLAGHPQVFVQGRALAAASILLVRPAARRGAFVLASGAALVLGGLLCAAQLVPSVELARQTLRAHLSFDAFVEYAIPWQQLATLLFPFAFGGDVTWPGGREYGGAWTITELSGSIGPVAAMLALLALFGPDERPERRRFWASAAIVAILISLGRVTLLARVLYHVPVINQFRAPARYLVIVALATAVLAALGVDRLLRARARVLPAALGTAAAAIASLAVVAKKSADPDLWRMSTLIPIAILMLALMAALLCARAPSPGRVAIVLGILAVDLGVTGQTSQWAHSSPLASAAQPPAWVTPIREALADGRGRIVCPSGVLEPAAGPIPNLSWPWGLPSATGYNPLAVERLRALLQIEGGARLNDRTLSPDDRSLDIAAARYVFDVWPRDRERFHPIERKHQARLFENVRALPRAWVARSVAALPAPEALDAIHTSRLRNGAPFDAATTALVEEDLGLAPLASSGTAEIVEHDPARVTVKTTAPARALLVLADTFYPGWTASIDGAPAPIVRADHAFRGVVVPSGSHTVAFTFASPTRRLGFAISALALVATLALASVPAPAHP